MDRSMIDAASGSALGNSTPARVRKLIENMPLTLNNLAQDMIPLLLEGFMM